MADDNGKVIVDAWMQQPTQEFLSQPFFESLRRWVGKDQLPAEISIDTTISAMDEGDVRLGLIAGWYGPQGPLITNEEVAAAVNAYPSRFVGIAGVDIRHPLDAVRELRRCVKHLGFKGLRIVPWLWNLPPNDRHFYPLYAECCELGVPVSTQVGHTGPLCPSEPGRPIPYLDEVVLDFPDLVIVASHIGYPWTEEAIALATKYPNVHIDTAAYKANRYPPELVSYMRGRGRTKVLFGSNFPMLSPQMCLINLTELGLDPTQTRLFLYENAERIFKLA